MRVYLNIGSNKGDRELNLRLALDALQRFHDMVTSSIVESMPWGFTSTHPFLNVGVALNAYGYTPHALLSHLQQLERAIDNGSHRDKLGNYIDRAIDIDIIAIDSLVINDYDLIVPHPHMAQRQFVLQPMVEIAPEWRHPITGLTATQMLHDLLNTSAAN